MKEKSLSNLCCYLALWLSKRSLNTHILSIHKKKKKNLLSATSVILAFHKKLTWKNLLNQSIKKRSHSLVRLVICTSFASKTHLNRHIESVHEGKRPFMCNICDTNFALKCNMKRHISSVHEWKKHLKWHRYSTYTVI